MRCKFFHDIGLTDFGFKDLVSPEPGRMRCMLSAVVNFGKFRDQQMAAYEVLALQSDKYVELHQSLKQKNEALTRELEAIKYAVDII